jgi:peptidoglycan hydrolase-like protein with peptidoglycan-binding domain
MAKTDIKRIDDLFTGAAAAAPIAPSDSDRDAVGLVQDLLIGFGNTNLPDTRLPSHGSYGGLTTAAVQKFRAKHGLPDSDSVDQDCLLHLAREKPADPMASRGFIALVLDIEATQMNCLMTLTALWETSGRFARLNLNTDRAGLSFGLIQWAQKAQRLNEILVALRDADTARFNRTFGGMDTAAGLVTHTAKPHGGVDPGTGKTTDPDFDLTAEPWKSRFTTAAIDPFFQRVQVTVATNDLQSAYDALKDHVSGIRSQRGIGFLMDVANQHGPAGALSIYDKVLVPAMSEPDLLRAMRNESVRRVAAQFGPDSAEAKSTAARRDWFLTAAALSNSDFGCPTAVVG